MAKCRKEPNQQGQYIITYTPVEVGVYTIHVRWNGRDIEGNAVGCRTLLQLYFNFYSLLFSILLFMVMIWIASYVLGCVYLECNYFKDF